MLKRHNAVTLTALACATLLACNGSDAIAPHAAQSATNSALQDKGSHVPGLVGSPHIIDTNGGMKGCEPREAQYGTATIGPSGGELDAGPHRLIIPPGALTQIVQMSATCRPETRRRSSSSHMVSSSKSRQVSIHRREQLHRRPRRRVHQRARSRV